MRPVPAWWSLYFEEAPYDERDRRAELADALLSFFAADDAGFGLLTAMVCDAGCDYSLPLDYAKLREVVPVPDLFAALDLAPAEALACLAAAAHGAALLSPRGVAALPALQPPFPDSRVRVLLHNHAASRQRFRAVSSRTVGQLVTVRGTVIRAAAVRPLIMALPYVCERCGARWLVHFPDGVVAPPGRCAGAPECKAQRFGEDREGAVAVDCQRLKLQELLREAGAARATLDAEDDDAGRVPRTLEVEVTGSLCDVACAGDEVTVCGVVKAMSEEAAAGGAPSGGGKSGGGGGGRSGRGRGSGPAAAPTAAALFVLYIDAVSVMRAPREGDDDPAANAANGAGGAGIANLAIDASSAAFSERDLAFVAKFHAEAATSGGALRLLTASLCPSIYGHALVKAGLLLALLGGSRPGAAAGTGDAQQAQTRDPGRRTDIHVLLMGDPGLGKSQLLAAAVAAAPRGVFVSGPTSSAAGLTAAVGRDASTGAPSLDAGACVQADCGVCGVDEFDKMKPQHGALLEVMEQGTVTIAKAGVSASLPARCALLAAANPAGGRYDRSKTVVENINMGAPLLSRFDLIFVLLDRADEEHDAAVSAHLLQARAGGTLPVAAAARGLLEGGGPVPLAARLVPQAGDEPLPTPLLRKYVAYARRYCHPLLSDDAKHVLKDFYMQLRSRSSSGDALPVTTRTLESLVRLTEARARAELRQAATAADAEDVCELMRESLAHTVYVGAAPGGFAGPPGGGAGGAKGEARRLLAALAAQAAREDRGAASGVFSRPEILAVADTIELAVPDLDSLLDKLNEAGELLMSGRNYKLAPGAGGGGGGGIKRGWSKP